MVPTMKLVNSLIGFTTMHYKHVSMVPTMKLANSLIGLTTMH